MRTSRFWWLRSLLLWSLVLMGCGGSGDSSSGMGSSPSPAAVQLQTVRTGLSALVFLTAPPTDTARLFVVEQAGRIQILDRATGTQNAAPFLDISAQIASSGEQGCWDWFFIKPDEQTVLCVLHRSDRQSDRRPLLASYHKSRSCRSVVRCRAHISSPPRCVKAQRRDARLRA